MNRLANLDILKIIATNFIIMHHYQLDSNVKFEYINFSFGSFYFGYFVELFFIISGFFTAYTLKSSHISYKKQFLRKIFRLVPYVWISFIGFAIPVVIYKMLYGDWLLGRSYGLNQIISSILMINQGWIKEFPLGLNNPVWYIDVLILCYLIYYILLCMFKNNAKYVYVVLVGSSLVLKVLHTNGIPFLHDSSLRGYIAFFIGILLYEIYKKYDLSNMKGINIFALIIIACLPFVFTKFRYYALVLYTFPLIVLTSASVKQLSGQWIQKWGGISFEAYLWHIPLHHCMVLICRLFNYDLRHTYITMIIFTIIVWLFARLLYLNLEVYISNNIKFNKLINKWFDL